MQLLLYRRGDLFHQFVISLVIKLDGGPIGFVIE